MMELFMALTSDAFQSYPHTAVIIIHPEPALQVVSAFGLTLAAHLVPLNIVPNTPSRRRFK